MKFCFYVSVWCHTEYLVLIIYRVFVCVKVIYTVIGCHENLEIWWNLRAAREVAENQPKVKGKYLVSGKLLLLLSCLRICQHLIA